MFLGQHGKMAWWDSCEWVRAGRGAPVEGSEPTRRCSGVSCGGSRWRVSLGCCRPAPVLRSSVAMSPRRSKRLEGRQPMSTEEAVAGLLALKRPGGAGPSLATEQSGAGEAIASGTGCHVDATPAWDPPPMSDEEGDGAPGPSGHQAAAALSESDSEPQPGPGADAEDRQSDRDEGGHDWMHSGQTARWIPGNFGSHLVFLHCWTSCTFLNWEIKQIHPRSPIRLMQRIHHALSRSNFEC